MHYYLFNFKIVKRIRVSDFLENCRIRISVSSRYRYAYPYPCCIVVHIRIWSSNDPSPSAAVVVQSRVPCWQKVAAALLLFNIIRIARWWWNSLWLSSWYCLSHFSYWLPVSLSLSVLKAWFVCTIHNHFSNTRLNCFYFILQIN